MLQNPKHLDVIRCIDANDQHDSLVVGGLYHVNQAIPKDYEGGGMTGKVTLLERGGLKFEWRRFDEVVSMVDGNHAIELAALRISNTTTHGMYKEAMKQRDAAIDDAKHCEQIASEACRLLCQFRPVESQQLIQRIKRAANGHLPEPEALEVPEVTELNA